MTIKEKGDHKSESQQEGIIRGFGWRKEKRERVKGVIILVSKSKKKLGIFLV